MSDPIRKEEVQALARKFKEAKTGNSEGPLSAEDMHLAIVALDHLLEVHYEYKCARKRPGKGWEELGEWTTEEQATWETEVSEKTADTWSTGTKFKTIRRRKAGRIEDV